MGCGGSTANTAKYEPAPVLNAPTHNGASSSSPKGGKKEGTGGKNDSGSSGGASGAGGPDAPATGVTPTEDATTVNAQIRAAKLARSSGQFTTPNTLLDPTAAATAGLVNGAAAAVLAATSLAAQTGANPLAEWSRPHHLGSEAALSAQSQAVSSSLFAHCLTAFECATLASLGELRACNIGARIFLQQDPAEYVYLIESGEIHLEYATDAARNPDEPLSSFGKKLGEHLTSTIASAAGSRAESPIPGALAGGGDSGGSDGGTRAPSPSPMNSVDLFGPDELDNDLTSGELFHTASPNLGTFLSPLHGRLTLAEAQASTLAREAAEEARRAKEAREAHAAKREAERRAKDKERSERLKTSSDMQFRGLAAGLLSQMQANLPGIVSIPTASTRHASLGAKPRPASIIVTSSTPVQPPPTMTTAGHTRDPSNAVLLPSGVGITSPSSAALSPYSSNGVVGFTTPTIAIGGNETPMSPNQPQARLSPHHHQPSHSVGSALQLRESSPTSANSLALPFGKPQHQRVASDSGGKPPVSPGAASALQFNLPGGPPSGAQRFVEQEQRGLQRTKSSPQLGPRSIPMLLQQNGASVGSTPVDSDTEGESVAKALHFDLDGGNGTSTPEPKQYLQIDAAAVPLPTSPSSEVPIVASGPFPATGGSLAARDNRRSRRRTGNASTQSGNFSEGFAAAFSAAAANGAQSPANGGTSRATSVMRPSAAELSRPTSPSATQQHFNYPSPGGGHMRRQSSSSRGMHGAAVGGGLDRAGLIDRIGSRDPSLMHTHSADADASTNANGDEIAPGIVRVGVLTRGQLLGICGLLAPQQVYLTSAVAHSHGTRLISFPRASLENLLNGPAGPRLRDHIGQKLIQALQEAPWLRALPPSGLVALASLFQAAVVPAGTVLFKQGDCTSDSSCLYLIIEGAVVVEVPEERSGRAMPKTISAGGWVGELSVIVGLCRTGTAKAQTPLLARWITRRSLMRFFQSFALLPLPTLASSALLASYPPLRDENLLEQMILQSSFARHCLKEFSAENVEFWQTAVRFRKVILTPAGGAAYSREQVLTEAALLYTRYVSDRSLVQINLKETVRNLVRSSMRSGMLHSETFKPAEDEILHLMVHDNFGRFKTTKAYKEVREELEAPAPFPFPKGNIPLTGDGSGTVVALTGSNEVDANADVSPTGTNVMPVSLTPPTIPLAPWENEAQFSCARVTLQASFMWNPSTSKSEEEILFGQDGYVLETPESRAAYAASIAVASRPVSGEQKKPTSAKPAANRNITATSNTGDSEPSSPALDDLSRTSSITGVDPAAGLTVGIPTSENGVLTPISPAVREGAISPTFNGPERGVLFARAGSKLVGGPTTPAGASSPLSPKRCAGEDGASTPDGERVARQSSISKAASMATSPTTSARRHMRTFSHRRAASIIKGPFGVEAATVTAPALPGVPTMMEQVEEGDGPTSSAPIATAVTLGVPMAAPSAHTRQAYMRAAAASAALNASNGKSNPFASSSAYAYASVPMSRGSNRAAKRQQQALQQFKQSPFAVPLSREEKEKDKTRNVRSRRATAVSVKKLASTQAAAE